ncbi:TetR/AcrR family transcriptional regulator C-terminal domain-containing protein [Herbiconiux moechotypicola]|uniref:TetR/AcrR family transcriptional regulator C-terminal domain-containing protein n=1 Tax=Herbiconiux moechotypicola TaxID=637393 RepID=A0ABN3DRP8_9MICO|nr:TetR/AcrR family transcriptional regulator C-terminal domain-containing protein [Herbiconiux moechotypicola]MCS5730671.1 TetR/AcrR family transcriptional regulator C-terminal domain-containing protein [Herbiconiux moechotypicola]
MRARAGRPSTPRLSLEQIERAALELIDETGDLQMTALAERLHVAPSSLYNHVSGLNGVLELIRRGMTKKVQMPVAREDWRESVRSLLVTLTELYSAHPNALPMLFRNRIESVEVLSIYDEFMNGLLDAGFSDESLMSIVMLVDGLAMGLATGLQEPVLTTEQSVELPALSRSIAGGGYDRERALALSIDVVVGGLEAMLRARD